MFQIQSSHKLFSIKIDMTFVSTAGIHKI